MHIFLFSGHAHVLPYGC